MSNNNPFEFSTDIDKLREYVLDLEKQKYNIQRKAMSTAGQYIASQVRASYKSFFPNAPRHHEKPNMGRREPKNLRKSVKNRAWRKPKLGQTIYSNVHAYNPFNPDAKKVLYGAALQKGFSITAKGDNYLTFYASGKWHKVKNVVVPSRPWITEPGERAAKSYVLENRVQQRIQKEIDAYEKKWQNQHKALKF